MPVNFPTGPVDPMSGWRQEEPYLVPGELAKLLHVSATKVRTFARDELWPSTQIAGHVYFSRADVDRIFELARHGPDRISEHCEQPRRLGVLVADEDLEELT